MKWTVERHKGVVINTGNTAIQLAEANELDAQVLVMIHNAQMTSATAATDIADALLRVEKEQLAIIDRVKGSLIDWLKQPSPDSATAAAPNSIERQWNEFDGVRKPVGLTDDREIEYIRHGKPDILMCPAHVVPWANVERWRHHK